MDKQDNKIIFTDDKGNQTELTILFTYRSEERNKMYVFFYHEDTPEDIIVGYLGENDEIFDVETDEEYDELEEVLTSYQEEHE